MNLLNRRRLIQATPGLLLATPAIAMAASNRALPNERAKELVVELVELLKAQAPEDAHFAAIGITGGLPLTKEPSVSASYLRREWQPDDRLKAGGLWVERGTDIWDKVKSAT